MSKLSPTQRIALGAIQRLSYVRSGDSETITDTVLETLENKGLVELDEATGWWTLTDAGQAALMRS